ncbi:homoserine O-acetyltransferase [Halovivax ruber XH-70]|uniref:Homoserine O-acetyltransferase n=1 Tax=Halovivax ruber (strain DSM 18193 / JCM 13892 / XH-70) TaxID=797302 RepID=L0I9Y6_HALRX|nr:homoserine O-acetyltransferase [Halovivax ruber]AGB15056.1 homoserine O-acetyltransferase [Halovivax ruber XH-70]
MATDSGVAAVSAERIDLGSFTFECGETVPTLEVAYETYGEFTGSNAVLVCHALTGSAHVARRGKAGAGVADQTTTGQARAWWDDTVGPGTAIDTTEYFVVCANVPGSCYGTTGPASENSETGEPYGSEFPPVTVGDWTRAQRRLLDELGVGRLHAVVGGSVGGMNALEWVRRYPDDVDRVAAIATAPRLDAQCLALDAIARRAITTDPNWNGGDYYGDDRPDPNQGLAIARQLGHVMYLSKESMAEKFGRRAVGRDAGGERFPPGPTTDFFPYRDVESYLDYNAEAFVDRFDANSYCYLTQAMDDFDLATGFGSVADALAAFAGEALVVSFTGDWHFTVEQSSAIADGFRETGTSVAHHVVDSTHGHDAFLVEPDRLNPPLADFLVDGVAGRAVTDTDSATDRDDHAPVHTGLF